MERDRFHFQPVQPPPFPATSKDQLRSQWSQPSVLQWRSCQWRSALGAAVSVLAPCYWHCWQGRPPSFSPTLSLSNSLSLFYSVAPSSGSEWESHYSAPDTMKVQEVVFVITLRRHINNLVGSVVCQTRREESIDNRTSRRMHRNSMTNHIDGRLSVSLCVYMFSTMYSTSVLVQCTSFIALLLQFFFLFFSILFSILCIVCNVTIYCSLV